MCYAKQSLYIEMCYGLRREVQGMDSLRVVLALALDYSRLCSRLEIRLFGVS